MTKQTRGRSGPRIFLSYAQEDQSVARRIEKVLARATQDSIVVGTSPRADETLGSGARREFRDSDLYVLVLTSHAFDSDRAQVELGAAWALEKPTLVVVSGVEPDLQVPLLGGLEVARVSVDELERPGVAEDILQRIARDSDKVA